MTNGFTLLEMLVSIVIIALLSIVLSQVFISTLRSNAKTEVLKEVKQSGDTAIDTLTRMVQNAQSVTCTTNQSVAIVNPDGDTSTIACAQVSGNTRLASSSSTMTEYLSSASVSLGGTDCASSTLHFTCATVSGLPTNVAVSFTLSQAGTVGDQFEKASESFQTSVSMRNND
jgi:prepilin-type N-terminal cleavage/methylation domain-containing protein